MTHFTSALKGRNQIYWSVSALSTGFVLSCGHPRIRLRHRLDISRSVRQFSPQDRRLAGESLLLGWVATGAIMISSASRPWKSEAMKDTWIASAAVTERIEAPIERAWELLSDFHSLPRRMPGITHFVVEGSGAGAIRTIRIGEGPILRERMDIFDPERHRLAYSLLPPAFLENYVAEIALSPQGTDACLVTWSGRCSVASANEVAERGAFFENVFRNGIAWVRKELNLT
jgi:hypothetical protein